MNKKNARNNLYYEREKTRQNARKRYFLPFLCVDWESDFNFKRPA